MSDVELLQVEIEALRAEVDDDGRDAPAQQPAAHPAITHCDNCGCDWLDNGLNPIGCPYCKQSEYKHTIAAQEAEIKALRAEVDEWKDMARCASEQQDSLFREALALNARAERLAEALEEIRSRSSINLAMQPDPFELTARLGDIYQIADAAIDQARGKGEP